MDLSLFFFFLNFSLIQKKKKRENWRFTDLLAVADGQGLSGGDGTFGPDDQLAAAVGVGFKPERAGRAGAVVE